MKKILYILVVICMFMLISASQINVKALDSDTIYVSSSGNDSNNGTSSAPVKTINRAMELVNNTKNTIQVLDDVYILDESNADKPFVIIKNVTIQGNSQSLPTIISRAGGIILGADVTFKDIRIGTASYLRPGIATNGHALKLINVHNNSTLRPLQIYGGTFIDYSTSIDYGSSVRGSKSNISIIGGSYEAIYAGSCNGNINIPINITVDKGNGLSCDGIYIASTIKNPGDIATSGKTPVINRSVDMTSAVSIAINNNAYVGIIDGVKSNRNVSLTVNGVGSNSFIVHYIDNITVGSGTFIIKEGSTFGNVTGDSPNVTLTGSSSNKATLDISEIDSNSYNITVNNFTGSPNGIYAVNRDYTTTIVGTLTGIGTEFRASNGMPWSSSSIPGYSGWLEYNTEYIISSSGTGTFVISNPYPNQEDMKFTSSSSATNGFITVDGDTFMPPELISFKPISATVSVEDINKVVGGVGKVNITVDAVYGEEEIFTDLSFTPFYYEISYKDASGKVTNYKKQESICDENGYYKCNYTYSTTSGASSKVLMKFEPAGGSINISKVSSEIKSGTYTISLTATTTSGVMTKKFTLEVRGESDNEVSSGNEVSSNSGGNLNNDVSSNGGENSNSGGSEVVTKDSSAGNSTSNKTETNGSSTTQITTSKQNGNLQTSLNYDTGSESQTTIVSDELKEDEENSTSNEEITTEMVSSESENSNEVESKDNVDEETQSYENILDTTVKQEGFAEDSSGNMQENMGVSITNSGGGGNIIKYILLSMALGGTIVAVFIYVKRIKKPCQ